MGLPSQGGRVSGSRASGRRRKKRGGGPVLPVLVLGVVGVGGWLLVSQAGKLLGSSASEPGTDVAEATAAGGSSTTNPNSVPSIETATDSASNPGGGFVAVEDDTPEQAAPTSALQDPVRQADAAVGEPIDQVLGAPGGSVGGFTPVRENDAIRSAQAGFQRVISEAERFVRENKPLEARSVLNRPLVRGRLTEQQAATARSFLTALNEDLFFSPRVLPGDPLTLSYQIAPGDSLARIESRQGLACDWRLIQRVNRISDPRRIRVGQRLKLVRGPFHAVVDKTDFRMDVFAGPPGVRDEWTYIRSFPVGLGEFDGTPIGTFVVRADSKLINPYWVNPRTGDRFEADDPENPIGERWIGLEGVGSAASFLGYGIHGTIDPDSIGRSRSMGCVRMRDGDVEVVYEMLIEGISEVEIRE